MKNPLNHPRVQRHGPLVRQFVTFALVGVANTSVSAGLYTMFTRVAHVHPLAANALAFMVAVTMSFLLNRRFTFRGSPGVVHHQYIKFFIVNIISLVASEIIIWFVHVVLGVNDLVAFGLATVVVLFWNFGANRMWTFRSGELRTES